MGKAARSPSPSAPTVLTGRGSTAIRDAVGTSSGLSPAAAAAAARACACFNFRRAARAVTRLFDEALQPSGLRPTQFVVLVAIRAEDPVGLPTLAERLDLDRSALTRALKPLESAGLVKVTQSPAGGSAKASLTTKGMNRVLKTLPLWKSAQARFVERFGSERWPALLEELGEAHEAAGNA